MKSIDVSWLVIEGGITEEDIATIPPVFWRKSEEISRRCQQAWINRIKRFSDGLKIDPSTLLILDTTWSPQNTSYLWKRVSLRQEANWRTRSRPWNFLLQYIYRNDIATNLLKTAHARGRCLNMRGNFRPETGYRITVVNGRGADVDKASIEEIITVAKHWFSHLATISGKGSQILEIASNPLSSHHPLQAPVHDLPISLEYSKVCISVSKVWRSGPFRFLKLYADPPGQAPGYATQFLLWNNGSYATNSGTILVGGQDDQENPLQLFLINTRTLVAEYAGALSSSRSAKTILASHYANLNAVHQTVT